MNEPLTIEYSEYKLLEEKYSEALNEIEKYKNAILNANKKQFGSRSERLLSEQIKFSFNQTPEPVQESLEQEVVVEKHTRKVKRGRNPLPDDLPREEIIYEPEQTHCGCCHHELVKIGEERSEELEKIPAQLKVIEHVRIKKACPDQNPVKYVDPDEGRQSQDAKAINELS